MNSNLMKIKYFKTKLSIHIDKDNLYNIFIMLNDK